MPYSLQEFSRSKLCPPFQPSHEDEIQDHEIGMRKLREHQQHHYLKYLEGLEPKDSPLHNNEPALHKPKRNEKWNEYMADYRKRKVECPKCGHQFKPSKRVK